MKKFQVTIDFEWEDSFKDLIPEHRRYISELIEQGVVDHYVVTLETQRIWITMNGEDKAAIDEHLSKSPFFNFIKYEIDELLILDGLTYRLPAVQLN